MIFDILLSFILGLLLVYVFALFYKPYHYRVIKCEKPFKTINYMQHDLYNKSF